MYNRQSSFKFLTKQKFTPRKSLGMILDNDHTKIAQLFDEIPHDEWISVDIETTGLSVTSDEIVVIGVATQKGRFSIDVRDPATRNMVMHRLFSAKFYAFNTVFDGSMLVAAMLRVWPELSIPTLCESIVGDSMILFKLMANEDNTPRNLDRAIKDVLGWSKSDWNKDHIKELLATRGLTKGTMSKLMDTDAKDFMNYCSLDAEASWQLMEHLRVSCEDAGFAAVLTSHDVLFTNLLHLLIEQRVRGMTIDIPALTAYKAIIEQKLEEATVAFHSHPPVRDRIEHFNMQVMEEYTAPTCGTKKIRATLKDEPWLHPTVWTKELRAKPAAWEIKHGAWFRIEDTVRPNRRKLLPKTFNTTSPKHLKWLFYTTELVQYRVIREPNPEAEKPWEKRGIVEIAHLPNWNMDYEMTKGGGLPIDKHIRKFFGVAGELLNRLTVLRVRLQFINGLLKSVGSDGILHPDIRPHGTVTGRCSGGVLAELKDASGEKDKLSILQLPKIKAFMAAFIPAAGNTFVQTDIVGLENVVMAELSRDPLLLEIFASGKVHDSYLFMAAKYDKDSAAISKVYLPDNPTADSVKEAKKLFKTKRIAWKSTTLGKNYGMAAVKLRRKLAIDGGVYLTLNETKELSNNYDLAVAGTTVYKAELETEWQQRGGWVMNAFGRPMGVPDDIKKDCANRLIQSTGHDILLTLLLYVNRARKAENLQMFPYIADLHDEMIFETAPQHRERAKAVITEAYAKLNAWLHPLIPIQGTAEEGITLADIKECVDD